MQNRTNANADTRTNVRIGKDADTRKHARTRLAAAFVLLVSILTAAGVSVAGADADPDERPGSHRRTDAAPAPDPDSSAHLDSRPIAIGAAVSDPVGDAGSAGHDHADAAHDPVGDPPDDAPDGEPDGGLPVIITPPPLPIPPVDLWHPKDIVIGGVVPDPDPEPTELPDLAPLPKVVVGLAGPTDIKHGSGCQVSCIVSGVAHARGTGASLTVETDTPAKIWVTVSHGTFSRTAFSGDERTTEFIAEFDDLEPGTTYHAKVRAQDAALHLDEAEGEFDTLQRHVRVEFGGVNVVEVADKGDFQYHFRVDGEWQETFSFTHWPYPYHHPLGGSKVVEIADAPAHLDVAVQVAQDHETKGTKKKNTCEALVLPSSELPSGTAYCDTWVSAPQPGATIELDGSPHGDGPPQAHSFSTILYSEGVHGLNFEAIVLIDVWYE